MVTNQVRRLEKNPYVYSQLVFRGISKSVPQGMDGLLNNIAGKGI